jgi:diguanylate cyclase (GGDEF)-like protein
MSDKPVMERMAGALVAMLSQVPAPALPVSCVVLTGMFGLADYLTGFEFSFSLFYLLPVMIAAWFAGRRFSIFIATLCAISWYVAEATSGQTYSNPAFPVWNAIARLGIFMIAAIMLSELKRYIARVEELSQVDPLTGSYNRNFLYSTLAMEIEKSRRNNLTIALMYIDIDNFKSINDTWGHKRGDQVLRGTVEAIKGSIRTVDVVSRIGGDEFVVMLSNPSADEVAKIAERIKDAFGRIAAEIRLDDVSLSMGVVTCMKCRLGVDELIERADSLMYEVKKAGKNGYKMELS